MCVCVCVCVCVCWAGGADTAAWLRVGTLGHFYLYELLAGQVTCSESVPLSVN